MAIGRREGGRSHGDVLSPEFREAAGGSRWSLDGELATIGAIAVWTNEEDEISPQYVVLAAVDGLRGAREILWTGNDEAMLVNTLVRRTDAAAWTQAVERADREARLAAAHSDRGHPMARAPNPAGESMAVDRAALGRLARHEGVLPVEARYLATIVTFHALGTGEMATQVQAAVDRLPRTARWILKRSGELDDFSDEDDDISPRHIAFRGSAAEPVAVFDQISLHVGFGPQTTASLRPSGWLRALRGA